MDKVVYLIGAGFSQPLGIPIMKDFVVRSKDLFFKDPIQYKYFEDVFKKINEMFVIKKYYKSDLFNIEEILSLLEMKSQLHSEPLNKDFSNYIIDVIKYYTPDLIISNPSTVWYRDIFFDKRWSPYGYFISALFPLHFYEMPSQHVPLRSVTFSKNSEIHYSIITLNYDCVFEKIIQSLTKVFHVQGKIEFEKDPSISSDLPFLAKLHGCVETGKIIPPTWSKRIDNTIWTTWKKAFQILEEANHIRIIGYSLPSSDSYFKYFLKSAAINSKHLKQIDVLCRDDSGEIEKRYNDFFDFYNFRFLNSKTEEYLSFHSLKYASPSLPFTIDQLESAHESFFTKNK